MSRAVIASFLAILIYVALYFLAWPSLREWLGTAFAMIVMMALAALIGLGIPALEKWDRRRRERGE